MLAQLYRATTLAATPLVQAYLARRCRQGKEDLDRLPERFGIASLPRRPGPLVWVHAASVGEAMSVQSLIHCLNRHHPTASVLMTTGTVAAARLIEPQLPPHARHQYVPVDVPRAVKQFLDHWRPDLALWVESELWPNLLLETQRRGVPMVLVNGRLSARSAAHWRRAAGLARQMLSGFALCLTPDAMQTERFRALGANNIANVGDLKAAAATLPADDTVLGDMRRQIDGRKIWLAASTHPGEEEIVAAAHSEISRRHPGLLTVLAPRHPARGQEIVDMIRAYGLRAARRSSGEPITPATDIYLADTLGELGLFYRLADIAFVGGSLVAKGGHNPFEAARLCCAILHGSDMTNCAAMAQALSDGGAAEEIVGAAGLAAAVSRLLDDPALCAARAAAARVVAEDGRGALDAVLERVAPFLQALAPAERQEAAQRAPHARQRAAIADARS